MPQVDDLSRSLVAFDQDATLIVVVEMSEASWLVAGMAPGVDRQPLKKFGPDPNVLLRLVERWRDEAVKAGKMIERIALAFEAGRDGFWLARWLQARGIEVHVIHSTSVAVSREHRRATTDRLDTDLVQQVLQGRAIQRSAGQAAVVEPVPNQYPAFMRLALDIGLTRLPLGVQRAEGQIQIVLGRVSRVDRAALALGSDSLHRPPPLWPDAACRLERRPERPEAF